MKPSEDYPRMMFHRSQQPVVIQSREEEDGLGPEWSRIIWPAFAIAEPAPAPEAPEPQAAGYAEAVPEPGGPADQVGTAPAAQPIRPARAPIKPPAAHSKRKRT